VLVESMGAPPRARPPGYPITAIMKISEYFEEYRAEGP